MIVTTEFWPEYVKIYCFQQTMSQPAKIEHKKATVNFTCANPSASVVQATFTQYCLQIYEK